MHEKIKIIRRKAFAEMSFQTPSVLPASTHPQKDHKNQSVSHRRSSVRPRGGPLKSQFKQNKTKTMVIRKGGQCWVLPLYRRKACRLISLQRRQLGLLREEGKIVDNGNLKKMLVTQKKQEYVQYQSFNTKQILVDNLKLIY